MIRIWIRADRFVQRCWLRLELAAPKVARSKPPFSVGDANGGPALGGVAANLPDLYPPTGKRRRISSVVLLSPVAVLRGCLDRGYDRLPVSLTPCWMERPQTRSMLDGRVVIISRVAP